MFRALGGVDTGSAVPPGEAAEALRAEFERAFALKASLRDEAQAPVSPTGRRTTADAEAKLRTLVASVEGASRFAIRLGLLDPGRCEPFGRRRSGVGCMTAGTAGSRPTRSGLAARRGHRAFPAPKPRHSGRPKTPSSRRPRLAEKGQGSAAAETLGRSRRRLTSASRVQMW
jgi:hypothetical protein